MKKLILFITLLIFNSIYIYADNNDINMTKSIFSKLILEKAPKGVCSEPFYQQCFNVTNGDCIKYMSIVFEICYKAAEQNTTISDSSTLIEFGNYGNRIGVCAGVSYEAIMRQAGKINEKCLSQSKNQ